VNCGRCRRRLFSRSVCLESLYSHVSDSEHLRSYDLLKLGTNIGLIENMQ
jgi:hypothetical protein